MNATYLQLLAALKPEVALVAGALVLIALDMTAYRAQPVQARLRLAVWTAFLATCAALFFSCTAMPGPVFGGVMVLDPLSMSARFGVLVLLALTLGVTWGGQSMPNPAEYVASILFAATGLLVMSAARQLLLAYVGLELASLSLYVIAGFDARRRDSAEAALKYFLFGGMAAAFMLFGFSLIYGITGALDFEHISAQIAVQGSSPLAQVALVMILVGFGFKAAAAPFHLWAPDVYQGAPAPAAALIASASKLAGFTLLANLFWHGLYAWPVAAPAWLPCVGVMAAASMVLGNIAALAQSNLRRLLAYSAIAHAGILLLAVMVSGMSGPGSLYYYAATYGLATVGAFGVVAVLETQGRCQEISDLAGLHRRSPFLALCLAVFVLSLAGIPPLAGFFGKFTVFAAALRQGGMSGPTGMLALLAIAMSAVSLYYYLIVLKQALVAPPAGSAAPIRVSLVTSVALVVAVGLIVGLGLNPSLILDAF